MKFSHISTNPSCTTMVFMLMTCAAMLTSTTTVTATSPPMTECGDVQLEGTINSDVLVKPNSKCILFGATINGSVYLQDSSKLYVAQSTVVKGNIIASDVKGDPLIGVVASTVEGSIHAMGSTMTNVALASSTVGGDVILENTTLKEGLSVRLLENGSVTKINGELLLDGVTTLVPTHPGSAPPSMSLNGAEVVSGITMIGCNFGGRFDARATKVHGNLSVRLTNVGKDQFVLDGLDVAGNIDVGAVNVAGFMQLSANTVGGAIQVVDTTLAEGRLDVLSNKVLGGGITIDKVVAPGSTYQRGNIVLSHNSATQEAIVENCVAQSGLIFTNTFPNLEVLGNTFTDKLFASSNSIANDLVILGNTFGSGLPLLTSNTVGGETHLDFAN